MSELPNSNCQFSSLLISHLTRLSSFTISHPLYFSYFIFFSPYLLKLVSFLSPLFITTFLVFLAGFVCTESSILERLQFKNYLPDEELHHSDDLEMFETVFGSPSTATVTEEDPLKEDENKVSTKAQNPCVSMEEKRLENFTNEFEKLASNVEEKNSDKAVEKQKLQLKNGSEVESVGNNNNNVIAEDDVVQEWSSPPMAKSQSHRITSSSCDHDDGKLKLRAESCRALDAGNLSRYGSTRRERAWERTLACKLLEERQNVGGMDSLWEAYEMEELCEVGRSKKREKSVEREWEEEDEEIRGQVCCLQALKMSAILGVGKPNLVKISKAIKGFGWLHKTTKNSKKVHNITHGDHRC